MQKKIRTINIIITIVGILIAIGTVVTDNYLSQSLQTVDGKIIIAFVLIVITFQLTQFLQQVEIVVGLERLSEMDRLLASVGNAKETIEKMIQYAALVEKKYKNEPVIMGQKCCILDDAAKKMQMLSDGKFETYFWKCSVLTEAVLHMREELIGLSPWSKTDEDWWDSADGKKFFEINQLMASKHKNITRIFLFTDGDEAKMKKVLDRHYDARITVYIVREDDLRQYGIRPGLDAMAVVDRRFAFWGETGCKLLYPDKNNYSFNEQHVKEKWDMLKRIQDRAQLYKPSLTEAVPH